MLFHQAYIKTDNTFGLKGAYQINVLTYYSISNGGEDTIASNNIEYDMDFKDFDHGNAGKRTDVDRIEEG